ncbi:MAG: TIGR01212 family radical SAM protein [Bacilli bacterium]|nr:TIGR01212 family radical SAM protein [Bacilli bacterium]
MIKLTRGDIMFKYSLDNKRYHTLNYHMKEKYKNKVVKISLNAGFTCPNIDGTKGYGGCIYCSKLGSGDFGGDKTKPLTEQFNDIKKIIDKKWPNSKYIAYFQARTNTYAPLNILKEKYESVLKIKDVIGISIATRADAITDECLEYLEELNKRTNLTIELGLQTIHENTAKLINRCHNLKEFENTYKKLKERNIETVIHIINGLPYETEEMMLETVKYLNKLEIDGIKIHMLNIIKDTPLQELYKKEKFHILTKEEYIDIVIKQLELLNPKIVIHRITSDPNPKELIEPNWLIKKFCVLNDIDKEMVKRNTYQGKKI